MHYKEKQINKKITNSIIKASDEVIKGKLDENFPLKVGKQALAHKLI